MPLIKRYPNRKLYDTKARRYVTLEEVAALIRDGHDVAVVDHATDEDLTAVTLAQILLGEEKRRGYLPQSLLAGLVRAGGQTLSTLRRALDAPLGLARQVDEEIERRLAAILVEIHPVTTRPAVSSRFRFRPATRPKPPSSANAPNCWTRTANVNRHCTPVWD